MKDHVFAQIRCVEPQPDCRDEKQIMVDLAKTMNIDGYFKTVEEALDHRLGLIGITFDAFKTMGVYSTPLTYKTHEKKGGFKTPSRKGELYADYLNLRGGYPLAIPDGKPLIK